MKGLAAFLPYMLASVYLRMPRRRAAKTGALQRSGWYLSPFSLEVTTVKREKGLPIMINRNTAGRGIPNGLQAGVIEGAL